MKNQKNQEQEQPDSNQAHESQTPASSTKKGNDMKKVNFILQGKGGIGKSFVSTLIAQYLQQADPDLLCLDTDPINATFSSFPALKVRSVALMEDNNMINEARFDDMMEDIFNAESNVVVDNGAASFTPLSSYLLDNEAFAAIQEAGKGVVVHLVIAGGLAQDNTVSDFVNLTSQLPEGVEVVVWLNEHFGPIEANGKTFEEMKAYLDNKDRVSAIIRLPKRTENTYGNDLASMLKQRLTFQEALQNMNFRVMSRQRLKIVQRDIYEQLERAI
jgi:Anion-transporting ATPase